MDFGPAGGERIASNLGGKFLGYLTVNDTLNGMSELRGEGVDRIGGPGQRVFDSAVVVEDRKCCEPSLIGSMRVAECDRGAFEVKLVAVGKRSSRLAERAGDGREGRGTGVVAIAILGGDVQDRTLVDDALRSDGVRSCVE